MPGETYTLHLTATGSDGANFDGAMRVLFDMGLDGGVVNLDNVSVKAGHNGTELLTAPSSSSDITITGVAYNSQAAMLTLQAAPDAFGANSTETDAFKTAFFDSYTDGSITYSVDGATAVPIAKSDMNINNIYVSTSDPNVAKLHIVIPGLLDSHTANILNAGTGAADTVSISGVSGIADLTDSQVLDPTDLIANGDFADDTGWTGAGVNVVGGVNQVNNDTVAANSYDVNIQTLVTLEQGKNYTLTFEARGEAGRKFDVGIGDNAAPWGTDKKVNLEVGADWQTYTLHLNSNALGTGDHRVFLDFGHDTGLFEIDEISSGGWPCWFRDTAFACD